MRVDNKGMSLVEIVIVVCIITIMTSLIAFGVGAALSKPADECAEKMISTFNFGRVTTMGKQSCKIELYQSSIDSPVYMKQIVVSGGASPVTTEKENQIAPKKVYVEYKLASGTTYADLTSVSKIVFEFDRSTGGFKKALIYPKDGSAAHEEYISSIKISKGARIRFLKLEYLTGKVRSVSTP